MSLKPILSKVIVKELEKEQVSAGGIILQSADKSNQTKAIVVAVGPGQYQNGIFVETTVKVNDIVYFNKSESIQVKDNTNQDYLVINETSILAIEG